MGECSVMEMMQKERYVLYPLIRSSMLSCDRPHAHWPGPPFEPPSPSRSRLSLTAAAVAVETASSAAERVAATFIVLFGLVCLLREPGFWRKRE